MMRDVGLVFVLLGVVGAVASGLAGIFYEPRDGWFDGWQQMLFEWSMAVLAAGFGVIAIVGLLLILLGWAFRWWSNKS